MTIKCVPSGGYYASLLVETESQGLDYTGLSVGFDLGQLDLLIGSDGTRFKSLKTKEIEDKLDY